MISYKGRTVIGFILIGMLLGGILTYAVNDLLVSSSHADPGGNVPAGSRGERASASTIDELLQTSGLSKEQLLKVANTFRLIDKKFYQEVDNEKVVAGAIQGMLNALNDPYSVYMDAEEAEEFNSAVIESTFTGIGAEVTLNQGKVTVVAPIKDSPADKAGIRAKDVILSVNGESLDGLTLNEAVAKIRGPKGTKAKLTIMREGLSTPVEIAVVRDEIDFETVYANMLEEQIGVIEVRQFAQNTAARFLEELDVLEKEGMKGLIIDLRNNPGGVMLSAIEMAQPFVPKGQPIVQVENRNGEREVQPSETGTGKDYPVVVLINNGSASASEILAAAIAEAGGGTLVGERTFGKGLVQSAFDSGVGDGSNIKMTIAKWLTPDGNFINEDGIQPHIEVKLPDYYYVVPLSKAEDLKTGSLHNDVRNLQLMLEGLGLEPDRKDGYFSDKTAEMVKKFQQQHALPVTGVVDNDTAVKIEQALIEKMMDSSADQQMNKAIEHVRSKVR